MKTKSVFLLILLALQLSINAQEINISNLSKFTWGKISETSEYILYSKIINCEHKKLNDWDFVAFKIKNKTSKEININLFADLIYENNTVKTRLVKIKINAGNTYISNCNADKDKAVLFSLYLRDYVNNTKEKLIKIKFAP